MSILFSVAQYLKKNNTEKFNDGTISERNRRRYKNWILLINLINTILFVYAMVLFFKCKELKGEFNFLEFCAAFCYSPIYVIYRLFFVKVNEKNCLSQDVRKAREIKRMQEIIKRKII